MDFHVLYNEQGYVVMAGNKPVYQAGNNPAESSSVIATDNPHALKLPVIEQFAISTATDFAEEYLSTHPGEVAMVKWSYAHTALPHVEL